MLEIFVHLIPGGLASYLNLDSLYNLKKSEFFFFFTYFVYNFYSPLLFTSWVLYVENLEKVWNPAENWSRPEFSVIFRFIYERSIQRREGKCSNAETVVMLHFRYLTPQYGGIVTFRDVNSDDYCTPNRKLSRLYFRTHWKALIKNSLVKINPLDTHQ